MRIQELVQELKSLPNCIVHPPGGTPKLEEIHVLPNDITEFYNICGGIDLFITSEYSISISSPNKFELANPIIIGERGEYDISCEWYIIGSDKNNDYITVDLNSERFGRCYDSFWDRHGVVGDCSIIATSFTQLLELLLKNRGQNFYWLEKNFTSLGDAYDDLY
ncbi:SMI1/KNR4 family protein [Bacillus spongiae]|uniref:SMI1/KNR4 family protein n=1 Tax=Bacillus spongiae TaxID=2683610 RepID=A0ABU8HC97_9BACI